MVDRTADLARIGAAYKAQEDSMAAEIAPVREHLNKIREIGTQLEPLRDAYLTTNSKSKKEAIDKKMLQLEHHTDQASQMLRIIDARTSEDLTAKRINKSTAEVRRNVTARYTRDLLTETQRQWDAHKTHEDDVVGQVARRVRIRYTDSTGQHKNEAECQDMARRLVRGQRQDHLFLQARAELEDAVAMNSQLLELQESVAGLLTLVGDLRKLVDRQADEVAAVEKGVDDAHRKLERGVNDLTKARKMS